MFATTFCGIFAAEYWIRLRMEKRFIFCVAHPHGLSGDACLKLRDWLLFALLAFFWGSNWSIMKMGLGFVPPLTFVLHRFILSVAVLLPLFLVLRGKLPRDSQTLFRLVVLCLIFVSIIILQALGLVNGNSGISAVLAYTQPLFVFCLAVPVLLEQVTVAKLLGVAVGFIGVVVLSLGRTASFTLDSVLILLLSALAWAVAVLYYKKYLSHVDPFVTHFLQLAVGTAPLIIWSLATNSFAVPADIGYLGILSYSSVGALAFGNVIYLFLLKQEEATTLSGSTLIIPTVALLFGWLLLGEKPSPEALLGAVLTLTGVYLVNMKKRTRVKLAVSDRYRVFRNVFN